MYSVARCEGRTRVASSLHFGTQPNTIDRRNFFRPFVHSPAHVFMCSSVHSFLCPFVRPFVRLFIQSFVHSFVRSFIHSFLCSFVRSFFPSSVRFSVCSFGRPLSHPSYLLFPLLLPLSSFALTSSSTDRRNPVRPMYRLHAYDMYTHSRAQYVKR